MIFYNVASNRYLGYHVKESGDSAIQIKSQKFVFGIFSCLFQWMDDAEYNNGPQWLDRGLLLGAKSIRRFWNFLEELGTDLSPNSTSCLILSSLSSARHENNRTIGWNVPTNHNG